MTLSTRFFEALALVTAKGKGMPDLKQLILPFPYESLPEARVRELARKALDGVIAALTRTDAPSLSRV